MRTDDGELVRQTLAGEQAAFAELVDRYRDAVYGVAYHHLGHCEDAQDAAQEAFIHAYLHLKQLRDPCKFAPWLRRITLNVCADVLRRRGDVLLSLDEVKEHPIPGPSSDEGLERLAVRLAVREALGHLSEKLRLTVTLFYVDGYSHAEIAEFLEVPVNTVRSRLQHAKKQLKEEMRDMITDVLDEGKPDPQFTRQVVEEAMRRGEEAWRAHAREDALRCYDEALAALEKWGPSEEQRHLQMEVLWKKGTVSEFGRSYEEMIELYAQALAIAEELGNRESQAGLLESLGAAYANLQQREKAVEHYQRALKVYEELGDARGQGSCLCGLGSQHVYAQEFALGQRYYQQALPLLEATDSHEQAAACGAMLNLLAEVGEERFVTLLGGRAASFILEKEAGTVKFRGQNSYGWGRNGEMPASLALTFGHPRGSVLGQVSQARKFLKAGVPVGGHWSEAAFTYSSQPLQTTVTVHSASERVTVPAGTFENCLLTEQVTTESDLSNDAPESLKQLNRQFLCGTRRAWYAPGVGLVQLHVQTAGRVEAWIQLKEFSVVGTGGDYLPLSIGNSWAYGWANVPAEYVARESYRVTAHEGKMWFVEHYGYLYKE